MGLNPLQQTLALCALGVTAGAIAQARSLAPLLDRIRPAVDVLPGPGSMGPLPATARAPGTAPIPPLPRLQPRGAPIAPMPPIPVEEPCAQPGPRGCLRGALASFDDAVIAADRHGSPLRLCHLGDSVVAVDKLTRRIRATLQARFGDGGTGWMFPSPPSRWYHPQGATVTARGWHVLSVVTPGATDDDYGLGGAVFVPQGPVTETHFQTARSSAARVEVHYVAQSPGDAWSIAVDDEAPQVVSTASLTAPGWTRWRRDLPDGPHRVTLRALGPRVRVGGVVLDRGRGATVDNLGLVGNSARAMHRNLEAPWDRALTLRAPDLVLITLGANEVAHGPLGPPQRRRIIEAYRDVLRRIRGANGRRACLVTSVLDAAEPVDGRLATRPNIPVLIPIQRAEALNAGCAFWDAFAWMGGRGSALRWHRFGWIEPDLTHPTTAGAARLGDALLAALFATRRPVVAPPPTPLP